MAFKKATKEQAKLRMAIHGPSGAGKTYSALRIASAMGKRIALIDTERGSASKYSDRFDFDVCEIYDDYNPKRLFDALREAGEAGYDCVIVDSLTHFWNGPGGLIDMKDDEVKKQKARGHKADDFTAWKAADEVYRRLIQTILGSPFHFFGTLRAKTAYEKTEGENGKKGGVKKIGMAPEMRNNFEYEFDVEGMLDIEHHLAIGKTRCDALDGKVYTKPGEDVAKILLAWLNDGVAPAPKPAAPSAPASEPKSEPKPKAAPPKSEAKPAAATDLPDNPQQKKELEGLLARLKAARAAADPDKEIEAIGDVSADAKELLKGAFLAAFKVDYLARYKELHPDWAAQKQQGAA